jgi:hypothetical protein
METHFTLARTHFMQFIAILKCLLGRGELYSLFCRQMGRSHQTLTLENTVLYFGKSSNVFYIQGNIVFYKDPSANLDTEVT